MSWHVPAAAASPSGDSSTPTCTHGNLSRYSDNVSGSNDDAVSVIMIIGSDADNDSKRSYVPCKYSSARADDNDNDWKTNKNDSDGSETPLGAPSLEALTLTATASLTLTLTPISAVRDPNPSLKVDRSRW